MSCHSPQAYNQNRYHDKLDKFICHAKYHIVHLKFSISVCAIVYSYNIIGNSNFIGYFATTLDHNTYSINV